jgi:hypothetical protein
MGALPTLAELRAELIEIEDVRDAVEPICGEDPDILLAMDISFWMNGIEIEPEEPVRVKISAPELEDWDDYLVVHIPDDSETPEAVEVISDEKMSFSVGTNEVAFQADSFSTYVVAGSNRNATVYYGFIKNGNFVQFSQEGISSSNGVFPAEGSRVNASNYTNTPYYLVYDFPGYTYKETRLTSESGTQIWPVLLVRDAGGLFSTDYRFRYSNYSSTSFSPSDLSNNSKIYVIYEPVVSTSGGSSGGGDEPPEVEVPDLPAGKSVEPNGDGTYNITLSVTGVQATTEKISKASVIVIFDTSGSMAANMAGYVNKNTSSSAGTTGAHWEPVSEQRLAIAKTAVNSLANTLLSKVDSHGNKLVQMALIEFNTIGSYVFEGFTSDYSTYESAVNSLTVAGVTNWEHALNLANSMEVPSDAPTYVVFVSDGAPTARMTRTNLTSSEIYNLDQSANREGYFGNGSFDERNYNTAVSSAAAIIGAGKEFYSIGLSTDAENVASFTVDAGADASHYFPATSPDDLTAAFDKIASAVSKNLGFTNVSINDGVTEMTTVETDALTGKPDNFVYRKGNNQNDPTQNEPWSGAPEATITDDNHVIWDTSAIGTLEPGVTYSVTFTVWPSQESYDIIADINNGIIRDSDGNIIRTGTPAEAYAAQPADIQRQIVIRDGVYTLLTNTGANVSYKFNGAEGESDVTVKKEGSMPLDTTYFSMKKDWQNQQDTRTAQVLTKKDGDKEYLVDSNGDWILDGEDRIEADWDQFNSWKDKAVYFVDLIVTKGGADYTEVRLTSEDLSAENGNSSWAWDQMFVAPGVLTYQIGQTSGTFTLRETGDDYTVKEKPSEYYYWELHAETYHPMVINGETCVLQLVTDESDVPSEVKGADKANQFKDDYFNIGGSVYKKLGSADEAKIYAVNERRSYLNLTKTVTGNNAPEDAYFTYTVKMENPNGLYKGDTGYTTNNDDFWFSIYDPASGTVKDSSLVTGATAEDGNTGYWHFENVEGGKDGVTIKIKAGWNVRFTNLLSGTTYEIEEPAASIADGFVFNKVEATAEKGNNPVDYTPTINGSKINGEITQPNTDYTVTYTNEYLGVFYVYHSSDNTVQRFPMAVNGVAYKAASGDEPAVTFDVFALKKDGTLYGGYYSDYAGKSENFDAAALDFSGEYDPKDEGGQAYTYAAIKGDDTTPAIVWDWEKAYQVKGTEMIPEPNQVYYLKEVPTGYMMPYTHYSYFKDASKALGNVWAISATDDLNYQEAGFVVIEENMKATMLKSMTINTVHGGTSVTLTPNKVFKAKGVQDGYLGYVDITSFKANNAKIMIRQYWVSPDGIYDFGIKMRELSFGDCTILSTGIKKTDMDYKPLAPAAEP